MTHSGLRIMLAHSTRVAKELGIAATNACAAAKSVCGHDRVWLVVRPRDRFVLVGAMGPVADIAARLFAGGSCIGSIGHFVALARGSASQPDCTSLDWRWYCCRGSRELNFGQDRGHPFPSNRAALVSCVGDYAMEWCSGPRAKGGVYRYTGYFPACSSSSALTCSGT